MAQTAVNLPFPKPGMAAERQYELVAVQPFTFTEVQATGTVTLMSMPIGAVVTGGFIIIDTAFNGTSTSTISLGDTSLTTRYATTVDLKTAALTALTVTGYDNTGGLSLIGTLAITTTADVTAGAGRLLVRYVIDGRGNEVQAEGSPS